MRTPQGKGRLFGTAAYGLKARELDGYSSRQPRQLHIAVKRQVRRKCASPHFWLTCISMEKLLLSSFLHQAHTAGWTLGSVFMGMISGQRKRSGGKEPNIFVIPFPSEFRGWWMTTVSLPKPDLSVWLTQGESDLVPWTLWATCLSACCGRQVLTASSSSSVYLLNCLLGKS